MKRSMLSFGISGMILVLFLSSNFSISVFSNQQNQSFAESFTFGSDFISNPVTNADSVNLTILYINDWHGWLEPHDGRGGAATYMGYFKQEGYDSLNDSYLILNGGDENTGPAVATLTKGEAMMDVMNTMNFTASVIGNHEFDYGIEWMNYRQNTSNFPLLSCNIFDNGTTDLANFTIPWVVQEHAGIHVGIVGLTTTATETAAHPKYTQYYDFGDYETALRANIPAMREAGAEVIIVLTHIVPDELITLASAVSDLEVSLFLGGHGGTPQVTSIAGSLVVMAGHYAQQYARIDLKVDIASNPKIVLGSSASLIENIEGGVTPDSEVQQVVDYWVNLVGADEVISYASSPIYDPSPESGIGNIIADGMLDYFNWTHDFSFTNRGGGIRDYFRAGEITIGDVVSVVPFENNILEITIAGHELLDVLHYGHGYNSIGNIRYNYSYDGGFHLTSAMINISGTFEPILYSNYYTGLMIDYMWWVIWKDQFPAVDTGILYRDAAIHYISKISDISLIAYDGRIQEGVSVISEYNQTFLLVFIPLSMMVLGYLQRYRKRRKLCV